jgi:hypothetical protein
LRDANAIRSQVVQMAIGNTRYVDAAGFPSRTLGLPDTNISAAIARSSP